MSLAAGARLLRRHLRPQRTALWGVVVWSALEAVPTFLSGLLVANAIDRGFLAQRPLVGFGWLVVLALLHAWGALCTRLVYPRLAAVVEPLRDSMVTAVVTATLRRALNGDGNAGGSSVAQATVHVETVRALFSNLLRSARQLLAGAVAAVGGLVILSPLLALVVAGFVLLAMLCFVGLLRFLLVRQRAVVLRVEQVGSVAAPLIEGMRDVVVAAAEPRAAAEVGAAIDAEAQALRAFARISVLRVPVVTVGAHLPLLALLALAPWLLAHHQLTIGEIVGGVFYLFTGLLPAIQTLVNAGSVIVVNLGVVLARLAEVSAESPEPTSSTVFPEVSTP